MNMNEVKVVTLNLPFTREELLPAENGLAHLRYEGDPENRQGNLEYVPQFAG